MHVTAPRSRTLAIVMLALGLHLPAYAQAPAGDISIYNFAKVKDDYYRGGQPLGEHYAQLAALGVKTVINLIGGDDVRDEEKEMVETHGMTYLHIPMSTRTPPTDEDIAAFMAAVDAEGAVYVHCVGGRHRTGVMTAVYRMNHDGISGTQAFAEMKQFKYGADFLHPEFKSFVQQFDAKAFAAAASAAKR